MQSRQNYTAIGVFEIENDADRAINELHNMGFRDDQIGVARKHVEAVVSETSEGLPEHEAKYYENEFAAGRTIVTANTTDKSNEANDILRRNHAYDMSNRAVPTR